MKNKKIIICATVKNEETNLNHSLNKIESLIKLFKDYYLIFVVSDSKDKSETILNNFINHKNGIIITKNFYKKKINRIKKLEICRNEYLKYIRKKKNLKKYDFLIIMDMDNINNLLDPNILKTSLKKRKWSAIFAFQKIFYYDIFALRIKNIINENYIKRIKIDYKNKKFLNHKNNIYHNLTKFFLIKNTSNKRFLEVDSAFGGFGIYKLNKIIQFSYNSNNGIDCEHVEINKKIKKKYGDVYIDTKLINSYGINKHTLNGLISSKSDFFAKRFIKKII